MQRYRLYFTNRSTLAFPGQTCAWWAPFCPAVLPRSRPAQHHGVRRGTYRPVGARQGDDQRELHDGSRVTVYYRQPEVCATAGLLARGRGRPVYGTAKLLQVRPVYDEVWKRLIQPEKDRDPGEKGLRGG